MQFTLGKMFVAVAMVALAIAGMKYQNRWWLIGIVTLTIFMFAVAALKAIVCKGRERATRLGFCVVGSSYFFLTTQIWGIIAWLPTTVVLAALAQAVGTPIGPSPITGTVVAGAARKGGPTLEAALDATAMGLHAGYELWAFIFIGQCLFCWLFAVLAAWCVGRMYDKRLAKEAITAAP